MGSTVVVHALENRSNLFTVLGIESRVLQQVVQCCMECRRWTKSKLRVSVAVTAAAFVANNTSIITIIIWHHFPGPSLPVVCVSSRPPARPRLRPAWRGVL